MFRKTTQFGSFPCQTTNPIWSYLNPVKVTMGWSLHVTALPCSFPATRDGEDGTKGHQHHAVPSLLYHWDFNTGPCRMSLWRSPQWEEARGGACFQPAAPLSLPHHGNAVAREMERAGVPGETWQREAASGFGSVKCHKWKQIWLKNNVVVSFVVLLSLCVLGEGKN